LIYSADRSRSKTQPIDPESLKDQFAEQLLAWQTSAVLERPLNADLSVRTVVPADEAAWQSCPIPDVEVRLLEYRGGDNPRFTALLRLQPGVHESKLGYWRQLEAVILSGKLRLAKAQIHSGHYLRVPELQHTLCLDDGDPHWQVAAHLYVAFAGGHYSKEDTEPRAIDTAPDDAWLPGPIDGIEVLPLHVHGSANAMLLRWTQHATFQPHLDPKGEELLVLSGKLADERGHYHAGTWIRNPEISWQHWSGTEGTVVFYKSGHFRATDGQDDATVA